MTRRRDQETFEALAEQNRAEIQLHCYRMLDSYHDAEDVIQETLAGYVRVVFALPCCRSQGWWHSSRRAAECRT